MKKYQYKVIIKAMPAAANEKKLQEIAAQTESELNQLGQEGWQFIQWKNSMMILKRKVQ